MPSLKRCNGKVFMSNVWVNCSSSSFSICLTFRIVLGKLLTGVDGCGISKKRVYIVKQRGLETASEKEPEDNHCCRSEL